MTRADFHGRRQPLGRSPLGRPDLRDQLAESDERISQANLEQRLAAQKEAQKEAADAVKAVQQRRKPKGETQ